MCGGGCGWLHCLTIFLAAQVGAAGGAWEWEEERMRGNMQVIARGRRASKFGQSMVIG